jgi:homoserine kinase
MIHRLAGECLATSESIQAAANLMKSVHARYVVVAVPDSVLSALRALIATLPTSDETAFSSLLDDLVERLTALSLAAGDAAREPIEALQQSALAARLLREDGDRARATLYTQASRCVAVIVAAAIGDGALVVDPQRFLVCHGERLHASPTAPTTLHRTELTLRAALEDASTLVIAGGVGQWMADSGPAWLGSGGADYSATTIAAAVGATSVTLWNIHAGLYSADPEWVAGATRLDQLNYREAAELSFFTRNLLHPRALQPASGNGIPVHIRSSERPESPGTVIDSRMSAGDHPVKLVSAVLRQTLISVEGRGLVGKSDIASRMFRSLSQHGITPTMISQASSQASICIAVDARDASAAEVALKQTFRMEISHGDVEEISVQPDVALLAIIGLGMAQSPGIAGRMMSALGGAGLNLLAIAQGSSELNITVALLERDAEQAVRTVHDALVSGVDAGGAPRMHTRIITQSVRAFAPATVANIGPGFDILGLALEGKGDIVVAERIEGDQIRILEITGDDGRLPMEADDNTAGIAARETLRLAGQKLGIGLRVFKGMPIGSGLGSSAASAAAAAMAVNLLLGNPLRRIQLVDACVEAETAVAGRHADNVAPAILGGLIMVRGVDPLDVQRLPVPEGLLVVVTTPEFELSTRLARGALPAQVPLGAMVRNSANLATFITACYSADLSALASSVVDEVVTPARAALIPGANDVIRSARRAGALASSISGSGPSIFALCDARGTAQEVGVAMQQAFARAGLSSSVMISSADCPGAGRA